MRFSTLIKLYFRDHWIRLVVCVIYGAFMTIIYNVIRNAFAQGLFYFDGMFIGGATLFLFGLLTIVNYFGGFDIFSHIFGAKIVDNHRETLFDFSVRKKQERMAKRFVFIDYLVIGTIFMIISAIFI